MNIHSHLKTASLGSGLLSSLVVASFLALVAAVTQVQAAESSVDSQKDLVRSFAFAVFKPSFTQTKVHHILIDEKVMDQHITDYPEYMKRNSANFILSVVSGDKTYFSGDKPNFSHIEEFAAPEGADAVMRTKIPKETAPPIERITTQRFSQRLIFGQPVIDKAQPVPVYKRAIFLRRDKKASPEIVTSELSGFASRVTEQVKAMSNRVMLYTMTGVPRNYPTNQYPLEEVQPRHFDAILMIWPKHGRIMSSTIKSPSNYRVVYSLDLEAYYGH